MARNRNLAGLAALGALGYMMAKGGKKSEGEAAASIEERGTMPRAPARLEDDRDVGGGVHPGGFLRNTETGEMYDPGTVQDRTPRQRPVVPTPGGRVSSTRSMAPAAAEIPMEVPSRGRREMLRNPQRGPAASDIAGMRAERATTDRLNDLTREMNRGQRGRIATPMEREPAYVGSRKPNVVYDAEGKEVRPLKKGGVVKMASGGSVGSASRRADGIAQRGKTRGRMR